MSESITKLTPSDLSALMCARICHDLVSPVGALGTALEVLDDSANEDMHADALDLVRTSSRQATAKLKYLRLAFGASTSAPSVIGMDQLKSMVADMYDGGKVDVNWATQLTGLEKNSARLLLNLIMVAMMSVPRGGTLTIRAEDQGDASVITLTADGPKARLADEIVRALSGRAPEMGFDGRTIQPFYTGLVLREIKGRLDSSIEGERVTFSMFAPSQQGQNAA